MANMLEAETETESFSMAEARQIVRDLFTPNPWIYWTDFLLSLTIAMAAAMGWC